MSEKRPFFWRPRIRRNDGAKSNRKNRCGKQRKVAGSPRSNLAAGGDRHADRLGAGIEGGWKPARGPAAGRAEQPDNTLTIWKLDRLSRDLRYLEAMVDDLRSREMGLKVLAGAGAEIDTTTPNGRLVFGIFAALAEIECELIAERARAGLAAAREDVREKWTGRRCAWP